MKLTVFGSGYVGLVTWTCLAELWHEVYCIDVDEKKIELLKQGIIPIYEPGLQDLVTRNYAEGRLMFSTDAKLGIEFAEVVFSAVGTPPDKDEKADLQYVKQVATTFATYLDRPKLLVNKSTVPVGTAHACQEIIQDILDASGKHIQFEVASNPEFLKEWAAIDDFMNPDRIVCGVASDFGKELLTRLYEPLCRSYRNVFFTDILSSEIIKYASNAFLATKISFINEIANFAELVWANVLDISRGMGMDSRIGNRFLHAGIGYGGSCFPKDVKALIQTGKQHGYDFKIIKSADEANTLQKSLPVKKLRKFLPDLQGTTIAIRGLAFKPKTDDIREAPSITVITELLAAGAKVQLFDPVAMENFKTIFPAHDQVVYSEWAYQVLEWADALLILTEWNEFRWADISKVAELLPHRIVIDGRNIRQKATCEKLWFLYAGIWQ